MGLKPSARETRLDNLRTAARKIGLQPKIVACPSWISVDGDPTQKGKGMIAQYGLIIEDGSMKPCDYQLIDGLLRPCTDNYPANFALDQQPLNLPASIKATVQGLSFKANFACIYWQETVGINHGIGNHALETTENDLILLKTQLQHYANLVQNG